MLGRGNFGAIKLAFRKDTGEYVASKKVTGIEKIAVSKAEAYIQNEAAGPNVLPIYNTIELDEILYHFMPLAGLGNGRAVQAMLASADSDLRMRALIFVARDILTGLRTCHTKGIYHLDIKPENIVFTKDGTGYVTDFGCAKHADEANSVVSYDCIGDNRYFPPERYRVSQTEGTFRADCADAWAAGLTLLEVAENRNLFQLLGLPSEMRARFLQCDEAFFEKQLGRIEVLNEAKPGTIYAVIKGLLEPDANKRLTVEAALKSACFASTQKASVFEQLFRLLPHESHHTTEEDDDDEFEGYSKTPSHVTARIYRHEEHEEYYGFAGQRAHFQSHFFVQAESTAPPATFPAAVETDYQLTPSHVH